MSEIPVQGNFLKHPPQNKERISGVQAKALRSFGQR